MQKFLGLLLQSATLLLCSALPLAHAGEPPTEPMLRIDPGEHTGSINRVASDAAGRYLVTAADDKTARVWSLADGKLLSTLRIPSGSGDEGNLYTVALSPDGKTVALGGWSKLGAEGFGNHNLYLFDRASGRLLRRLSGLPNVVSDLAFSTDGRTLAAGFGRDGIRLFSVADGSLLSEDRDYGAKCFSVHFNADGRLVTASGDGFVRLYRYEGKTLALLSKLAAPGGKRPNSVRFSPDGGRVAVGFVDSSAVNVLDASDLTFAFAPDTQNVDKQRNLSSVAWSQDGKYLYAGGTDSQQFEGHWVHYIRRWPDAGKGAPTDLMAASSTLMGLASLPAGNLAFGSAAPEWGTFDATGRRQLFHAQVGANLGGNSLGFSLSNDGDKVRFGYEYGGKFPIVFDIQRRTFLPENTPSLNPPITLGPAGWVLTDWKYNESPKLNGQALQLDQHEKSRSLAWLPDGAGFALGADWWLRVFDRSGNQRWRQAIPGVVWAVNVSADGRWVVAAYGDGTIRWHRASDGVEQLAFFPHADKKRWVLWAPSGYYDASPGAEDLIGWHVNNGKDQAADFFPASRFRERFNRPDVLAKIFETQDEVQAVRLANEASGRRTNTTSIADVLPPVVAIVSPATDSTVNTTTVKLRYSVRTATDAPVTSIRVRVNGQAVSADRAIKRAEDAFEIDVVIPQQDSEIALFAESKNGVSTAAILRVTWAGKIAAPAEQALFKSKLYVLAVGVSKYKNPDFNLGLAAKDARDFAAVLQQQKGKLYGDVVVKLLTDDSATRDDVVDGLDWLKQQVTSRDVGIMFIAGHGMNDNTGKFFFLPHNADPDKLMRTGVAQGDIKDTLNTLAGKAVFFVDTCHSGNALGTSQTRAIGGNTDAMVNELASAENGVVVFASSTGKQLSQENPAWGNGAFTKAVVEGLSGKADFAKNGKITHKGLDYYVTERVKELTAGKQSPVSISPGGVTDFPIAAVEK